MTTVLIVNDHALQRLGLRLLLEAQPDLTVVGEVAHGPEAVRAAAEIHPEVVLMDMDAPREEDIQALRRIARPDSHPGTTAANRARGCPPRVLALIPFDLDAYTVLRAGAGGYLLNDALPDELAAALRTVADGNSVISPRLTRELVNAVRHRIPDSTPQRKRRLSLLTEREGEVLTALASGWSDTEFAERLSIASTTVKTHISSILTKLDVRARVQAGCAAGVHTAAGVGRHVCSLGCRVKLEPVGAHTARLSNRIHSGGTKTIQLQPAPAGHDASGRGLLRRSAAVKPSGFRDGASSPAHCRRP